ncbi:conserved hypothetical protein [Leishmania infantum JPCM5]|uniref:Uncharacterized protein n=2 Tax=Leishmania infantum TaxID=5671 RepID=A4I3G5_LEIIN|nr:conserved hypothetical protein [Leishmania infantum JPCM5]CAC9502591.1 hypothetical_protein_-_conserved [Leishmania infantum]CAM69319.1 conserved hypothetical protein [Leishmania infantum JPCM5]SUZ43257.1 hypothetical_protein_-_conserved [Leishmania infantum]|eukprot:XP_001470127.1 conserved hypothetical protein [Leishmania infantum JPCM5]
MKAKSSAVPRKARKSISFNANRNKVRFIRVPPRSQNGKFWFTETQRIVKKGLNFEVEPEIMIEVNIECRMQITALARRPLSQLGKSPAANGIAGAAASSSAASAAKRSYVEVEETVPLFLPDARKRDRWQCIGSVGAGEMSKVRVVMPPGSYRMRCNGGDVVQIFAQAWDIERELI